jgi:CGNR zinc finger/Putative stress-induced transcription regulator
MSWAATTRYELEAAPGSLALVQDFVNTIAAGTPRGADLLADVAAAQAWLDGALAEWSLARGLPVADVALGEGDLTRLRGLRAQLIELARAGAPDVEAAGRAWPGISASSTLRLDGDGRVQVLPSGRGWKHVASVLLIEMYAARLEDNWRRLKTCSNQRCSAAFFDRSRNNSRVWHDVTVCGNLANLHAHRARKRAQGTVPAP